MSHLVFGLLSREHDMYRELSGIGLLRDGDAVLQTVKTRLLLHYNEWFLDRSAGLPWFTELMKHNPNFPLIESRVAETIIGTDGVVELVSIALSFKASTRKLFIDFSYIDVYGGKQTATQGVGA